MCSSSVGAHGRGHVSCMGAYGSWACIGHGRVWVMGTYHAWVHMGCRHVWVVGAYGAWVGSLLAVGGRYAWVRGCLVHGRS